MKIDIREIERELEKKTTILIDLLNDINRLEDLKHEYYEGQRKHCRDIKNILNHVPFID